MGQENHIDKIEFENIDFQDKLKQLGNNNKENFKYRPGGVEEYIEKLFKVNPIINDKNILGKIIKCIEKKNAKELKSLCDSTKELDPIRAFIPFINSLKSGTRHSIATEKFEKIFFISYESDMSGWCHYLEITPYGGIEGENLDFYARDYDGTKIERIKEVVTNYTFNIFKKK